MDKLEPQPGCSKDFLSDSMMSTMENEILNKIVLEEELKSNQEQKQNEQILIEISNAEEYLENKGLGMIEYEKQIFLDLLNSDGLVVCGKGITYEKVLINLIKIHCHQTKLILIVNSSDFEEKEYKQILGSEIVHDVPPNQNERQQVYHDGGVLFISTQILVVDLLKKKIPVESITGIIVLRAHKIIESCQEAFALRLYRQSNKIGFIKAFSNSAESFTYGFGHVEKVMRNLFIKDLFIWPRFHMTVQKSLKPFEPQVIELHVPMTSKMIVIQTHILDLMNYTVKELKRINLYLDLQEITVENCVTKKFHKILQAQLDSVWHQLSSHTKLLISDLKVLRSLMISVIYNDAVILYANVRKYRSKEYAMASSGWVLLESAEQLFNAAKDRLFNSKGEFEPELPAKWSTLSEILRVEIPEDLKRTSNEFNDISLLKSPVKVLILCQDARTCYQLNEFLTQGGEKYLFHMAIKNDIAIGKISDKYKMCNDLIKSNEIRLEKVKTYLNEKKPREETKITEEEELTTKQIFLKDRIKQKVEKAKEEEMKEEKESEITLSQQLDLDEDDDLNVFHSSYVLKVTQIPYSNDDESDEQLNATLLGNGDFESFYEMENLDITSIVKSAQTPTVFIQTFKNEKTGYISLERTLCEINPKYVIMYHTNVTAIRQIEIFEARQNRKPQDRLKVFFLLHAQTVEEQSYLTSLRREKQAFELLIKTRISMVVPEYQDGKSDDLMILARRTAEEENVSSRMAGGQLSDPRGSINISKIIVDSREFRSDLPCLIHKRGIEVVPVMITVGDYILTPEICVERKSISDLIGSLNSGRLYNQCIQMCRFYTKPILLIEFDQNKPFNLQGHYMISGDTQSNANITQKLQLLTLHFPKLKLVWSPSPYATAKLFEELKLGKSEPNVEQITSIGSDNVDLEVVTEKYNTNIYDFLLKLPGINPNNINKLMKNVKNLKELIKKDQSELEDLLMGKQNAKMLWEILHLTHKPIETDTNDKQIMNKKIILNRKRKFK